MVCITYALARLIFESMIYIEPIYTGRLELEPMICLEHGIGRLDLEPMAYIKNSTDALDDGPMIYIAYDAGMFRTNGLHRIWYK